MKCINIKASKESIQFDCPHCGVDAEIDDDTIGELWTHFSGQVTCPPPQGCNMQFEIPAVEDVKKLRAGADSEPEEEVRPSTPNSTGARMLKPKSDEENSSSSEEELEKHVASNDGGSLKVTSPLSIRTFRHMDCIAQGQDKFDETVSAFLGKIGRENVISVTPFTYMEKGENWTDYGVIVYFAQTMVNEAQPEEKKSEQIVWRV